jgi:beta-phosphoglucomutase
MTGSKAVLWDMDGTLVDSEGPHWIAWRTTMANEGIVITREQFLWTFGPRNDSIIPAWLGSAASAERIERIGQAKEELYRDLVQRVGIAPGPRVAAWLDRLHKDGWQQAVASAAPRANINAVLEALSVKHVFQGIVSAEDVRRGKPDPEVYQLARPI